MKGRRNADSGDVDRNVRSSFRANARLKSSLGMLESVLGDLPALVEMSKGTRLTYAVLQHEGDKNGPALIIFEKYEIVYTFNPVPDGVRRSTELAKFISLLAFVDGVYEIDFSSIYRYVVDVLAHADGAPIGIVQTDSLIERINALSGINQSLSHDLIKLRAEVAPLKESVARYKTVLGELLEWLHKNGFAENRAFMDAVGNGILQLDNELGVRW